MNREFCPSSCFGKAIAIDLLCNGCRREDAKAADYEFETKGQTHQGSHQIDDFVYDQKGIGHHISVIHKKK
jgi:hypothetical protein